MEQIDLPEKQNLWQFFCKYIVIFLQSLPIESKFISIFMLNSVPDFYFFRLLRTCSRTC